MKIYNKLMRIDLSSNGNIRSSSNWAFPILLLITSISVFVPFSPRMPGEGLDPSWALGINQAITQGLQIGRNIIFTFGPYASIYTKSFHPETDNLMIWGSLYIALSFCLVAFLNFRDSDWRLQGAFLAVLAGVSHLMDPLMFYYPLLVGVYIFKLATSPLKAILKTSPGYILIIFLVMPFGLLPLIKSSFLIVCVATSLFTFALLGTRGSWGAGILACIVPPIASVLFWIIAGQTLRVLPLYFLSMLPIIGGYTEAMMTTGDIWEAYLYVTATVVLLSVVFFHKNVNNFEKIILFANFSAMLFMGLKGGFVRHDGHAISAGSVILLAALLVNTLIKTKSARFALFLAAGICVYIDSHYIDVSPQKVSENILATYRNAGRGISDRILGKEKLTKNFSNKIAALHKISDFPPLPGTTDIYSYDQSYLIASKNKWNPRPIFQSYSAYTPALAEKNKSHLIESNSPDNLIFKVQTIDGRIPSLDDGVSWPVIFSHYEPKSLYNGFLFLKKRASPLHISRVALQEETHNFGDIVNLPNTGGMLFVKINIYPTVLGKAMSVIFKSSELAITVNMANGAIFHYRIIAEMARTGFLLSPLIQSTDEFGLIYAGERYLADKDVKSISITAESGKTLWTPKYEIQFIRYDVPADRYTLNLYNFDKPVLQKSEPRYLSEDKCAGSIDSINSVSPAPRSFKATSLIKANGWMAISTDNAPLPDDVYLALSDKERHVFLIKTHHTSRPDVAAHFKNERLMASGYSTTADVSGLDGHYHMSLAYRESGMLNLCSRFNTQVEINGDINHP